MAVETWIEEFLFRGRPPSGPGSDAPVTFQVTIGRQVESALNPGEYERRTYGPLTPEQAATEPYGMDLSALVAGINVTALDRVAELEAALSVLEEKFGVSGPSPEPE